MSNNKSSYPFYANPMGRKRSVQIIKETKAEIKKMESHRPSTPFGLKKSEKEHYMLVTTRPSSSSSLKSLNYEHEEDGYLQVKKLNRLRSSKEKDTTSHLKLEPLVSKSVLVSRKQPSFTKLQNQQEVTFPPIVNEEKSKEITSDDTTKHDLSIEAMADNTNHNVCDNSNSADSCNEENFQVYSMSSSCVAPAEDLEKGDLKSDEMSQELKHIMFVLDKNIKAGTRKCEEDHIITVCKLHNFLREKNAFPTVLSYRIPLLKLLFKLLDSNLPTLSLHTIQLLLELKVRDKNLGTIFRLISKLISNKQVSLEQYHLIEPLIEAIQEISLPNNRETVLHGINVLQSLIFKNEIKVKYQEKCCLVLIHHLSLFNAMMPSAEERCDDTYIDLNKQIFVTLHYLIENGNNWKILSSVPSLCEILKGLRLFYQNSEIIQTILRLISKIIDKEDACQALVQCPEELIMVFPLILKTHRFNMYITVQISFIIGNLVLTDKEVTETFFNQYSLHDVLIELLEVYVKEHIQPKRTLSDMFKMDQGYSSGDHNWQSDVYEVISKVLCILANACLSPEAGYFLAQEKDAITRLLNMIGAYLKQETQYDACLPVYSFLVVVCNISYYLVPDSPDISLAIAKRVIPLLDDKFSFEVRREAANIVQNLSRFLEVRKYIEQHSLVPAFVKLLSEDDKTFYDAACGIIMNLLLDADNHPIFYKEEGITRILHKLHLCLKRDWKTSSVLCQILWNYCKCLNEETVPISRMEAQHLIKCLTYSTSEEKILEEEESSSYLTWKTEFCPVAKKLLRLLQSKNSSIT